MPYQPNLWRSSCLLVSIAVLAQGACSDNSSKSSSSSAGGAGGTSSGGTSAGGASSTTSGGDGATASGGDDATASGGSAGSTTASTASSVTSAGGSTSATSAGGSGGEAGAAGGMAGAGSEASLSVDEFCDLLQDRARSWLRECRSFGDSAGWWGTQRIDRFCTSGRAAIDAGRLDYDPVQAQACAEHSQGGCGDVEAFAYSVDPIPQASWARNGACEGVVAGNVALGDECHAHSTDYARECVEGYCTSACPGVCSEFLGIGDPCDPTHSGCDPNVSFCHATEERCQAYVEPGGECGDAQCAPGSFCRYDESQEVNSCVQRVAAAGPCDAELEQCETGLTCHEGTCVDQVPLGALCNTSTQCPAGTYCDGTCQSYAPIDGDCSAGEQCVSGSLCDGNSCVPLGALEDPCPCDAGLYCGPDDLCIAEATAGQACGQLVEDEPSVPCVSGLSCVPSTLADGAPSAFHCQAVTELGDACLPQNTSQCPWPLFCHPQSFSCVERASESASCSVVLPLDSCQDGLFCLCTDACEGALHEAVGECTPRLANGMDCSNTQMCQSSLCNGTCQAATLCY